MVKDANGAELREGDRVSLEGIVQSIRPSGLVATVAVFQSVGLVDTHVELVNTTNTLKFVSRPEPTASVELTLADLNDLCGYSRATIETWAKFDAARQELRNA